MEHPAFIYSNAVIFVIFVIFGWDHLLRLLHENKVTESMQVGANCSCINEMGWGKTEKLSYILTDRACVKMQSTVACLHKFWKGTWPKGFGQSHPEWNYSRQHFKHVGRKDPQKKNQLILCKSNFLRVLQKCQQASERCDSDRHCVVPLSQGFWQRPSPKTLNRRYRFKKLSCALKASQRTQISNNTL